MGLPDDQPIPAARIAIEEVEVEVETINNCGHRLLTPAALPRLTLFYLFALEVTNECRYRVVLGNHLLVVGFDLDGCPGAENGRYFLENPGIFAELRRGDHGHVLLEILYVLAFLLGSPVGNLVLLLAGEVRCLPLHLHCPIYLILYAKCSRALKEGHIFGLVRYLYLKSGLKSSTEPQALILAFGMRNCRKNYKKSFIFFECLFQVGGSKSRDKDQNSLCLSL